MTAPICICGVGSPFGDDGVGWQAMEFLERSSILARLPPGKVMTCLCDRPGPRLLEFLRGAELAIIIDAILSGAPPGTIRCVPIDSIAVLNNPFSTHGFDLASTLALGKALGELPPRVFIYGVEIATERLDSPSRNLSPSLIAVMPELIKAIEIKLQAFIKGHSW